MENQPLVSVPVITYNSSKYVIETLESIKAQTYQNLELIVSDDCSTDNTVELCRNWIDKNKGRFVRTELLTVEKNTGVSGNCNRAQEACRGEWVKGIAGDDLLVPECVEVCIKYVTDYPNTIFLFGRQKAFGAEEERCNQIDDVFDYSFFKLTQEEQLHRLIFDGNCVPATTAFYNNKSFAETGVKNDERIPLLEDWPKWINLLKAGVKFNFIDMKLVKYRLGGVSTHRGYSPRYYESLRRFWLYYIAPEKMQENYDDVVQDIIEEEMNLYQSNYALYCKLNEITSSFIYKMYKLYNKLVKPISYLKRKM